MPSARTFLLLALAPVWCSPALAVLTFDDDVTPGVIFGSGNANGGWTIDRNEAAGMEIALRAKQRFPTPANVFNSDGAGTYTFPAVAATSGAGWITSQTPVWNFEFAINSNYNNNGGFLQDSLTTPSFTYILTLDFDPSTVAINGPSFDALNPLTHGPDGFMVDNSFGDNSTTNTTDTVGSIFNFPTLITTTNVAQNSQNYEFWNNDQDFDPTVSGEYTITLTAFDGSTQLASTSIIVSAVPEPTAALFGTLIASGVGLCVARRPVRDDD